MRRITFCMVYRIILWVVAGLLAAFAVWAFIQSAGIISEAKAVGQLTASGSGYVIFSFYMSNSWVYLVYALSLAALGLILHRKDIAVETAERVSGRQDTRAVGEERSENDRELEDLFQEANKPMEPEDSEDPKDPKESEGD